MFGSGRMIHKDWNLKILYVKGFEPWGWVIGTGIYTDDVNTEDKAYRAKYYQCITRNLRDFSIIADICFTTKLTYRT